MTRDPYYLQILTALAGTLDPDALEQCAADLLRDEWPTLVPVPGGSDAGMDGAIGHIDEPPTILVCTTGTDVKGNLRRSLRSHLANGLNGRKAIVATSQELSPRRVQNLYTQAAELGFELRQVYQRRALADRLYQSPRWCRDLLNLAGDPPAISAIPLSRRPTSQVELVGRQAELAWLRATSGDRLVVGQPGSGKTSLLWTLVDNGLGGFLVDVDPGRIADAIRSQAPDVVIVDDAQVDPSIIDHLRQIRTEMGSSFAIVASSWPGDADRIRTILGISTSAVCHLPLLTRDEVVRVIRSVGLAGPDELVRAIVDQARGRPGLAATLTHLCLAGDDRDVYVGDALSRDVRDLIQPVVGEQGIRLLACFGLGGLDGMSMAKVSDALRLSPLEISGIISGLGFAGIVEERDRDDDISIVVVPDALRHALVRDVFFNLPGRLDYRPLLAQVPSKASAARALVGAAACGADVSDETLRGILAEADSVQAWKGYAWLGSGQAAWIVDHHSELVVTITDALLDNAPERTLPLLLERAEGDYRPLPQHPDHPLRQIEAWIEAVVPGSLEGPLRRSLLLAAAETRWRAGRDGRVASHALAMALSPKFDVGSIDPGAGNTYRWRRGPLRNVELEQIGASWPRALALLADIAEPDWPAVFSMLTEWTHPDHSATYDISQQARAIMRSVAETIVGDLAAWPGNRAVLHRACRVATGMGLKIAQPIDEFALLYPEHPRRYDDWEAERTSITDAIRGLAERWSAWDPDAIASKLESIESEAYTAGLADVSLRRTPDLATELAGRVEVLDQWLEALMSLATPVDVISPFLRRAVLENSPRALQFLGRACAQPELKQAAVWAVASCPAAPFEAWDVVWNTLSVAANVVQAAAASSLPEELIERLLNHDTTIVATAAAVGEWEAQPSGTVRPALEEAWRDVIGRSPNLGYDVAEILKCDSDLGVAWIEHQLESNSYRLLGHDESLGEVIDSLGADARRGLLERMEARQQASDTFIARLVGDDPALYRTLLDNDHLQRYHLSPLEGRAVGNWKDHVIAAAERGYPVEDVADAVIGWSQSWSGFESTMWEGWITAFTPFLADEHPFVRAVSEEVTARVTRRRDDALEKERHEAIWGRR